MRILKFKRFEVDKPYFDNNPQRSTTDNVSYRKVLMVIYEDYFGNEFAFLPKWNDILNLNTQAVEVELLNKKLYREQTIEVTK